MVAPTIVGLNSYCYSAETVISFDTRDKFIGVYRYKLRGNWEAEAETETETGKGRQVN